MALLATQSGLRPDDGRVPQTGRTHCPPAVFDSGGVGGAFPESEPHPQGASVSFSVCYTLLS